MSGVLAFNAPTAFKGLTGIAASPQVTEAPTLNAELMRRDGVNTALIAPDNTCGYGYYCMP